MIPGAKTLVPISALCGVAGTSQRALKRRLKRIESHHPGILQRFAGDTNGTLYVDLVILRRAVPAYADGLRDDREGIDLVLDEVRGVRAVADATASNVAQLRDNVASLMT